MAFASKWQCDQDWGGPHPDNHAAGLIVVTRRTAAGEPCPDHQAVMRLMNLSEQEV
jgi:hypothetical protein